jgi:L-lactate dehydrogenase complex protein LldE
VKLLEDAGCRVVVPDMQTCCGQPAYNSGDRRDARALAMQVIAAFEHFDHVVVPSGSCGGMIAHHFPGLFDDDPGLRARAEALAGKTHELISFLVDVLGIEQVTARYEGTVTYHDSCSGLRELGIKAQPPEVCCGFGGTFCVKYPAISNAMLIDKTSDIAATGADTLLAGDLGCLMNMAGKLQREGRAVRVRHVAEVLAGMGDMPAIGETGTGHARAAE